ncbi:hypothetical protein J6590_033724 [Homalodisca vitripennis]|nr:hypothetical protein J6590_033724 [Homalodisca vitripennis]
MADHMPESDNGVLRVGCSEPFLLVCYDFHFSARNLNGGFLEGNGADGRDVPVSRLACVQLGSSLDDPTP